MSSLFVAFFALTGFVFSGLLIWHKAPGHTAVNWIGASLAMVNAAFFFLFGMIFYATDFQDFFKGVPMAIRTVLVLPLLAVILTIALASLTLRGRLTGVIGLKATITPVLSVAVSLMLFWWLNYWNLLGFHY